jgi:hypothetical protein
LFMCPANCVLCEITVVVPYPKPREATGIRNAFKGINSKMLLEDVSAPKIVSV